LCFIFWIESWVFAWASLGFDPPTVSHLAGATAIHCHTWLIGWDGVLLTFCPDGLEPPSSWVAGIRGMYHKAQPCEGISGIRLTFKSVKSWVKVGGSMGRWISSNQWKALREKDWVPSVCKRGLCSSPMTLDLSCNISSHWVPRLWICPAAQTCHLPLLHKPITEHVSLFPSVSLPPHPHTNDSVSLKALSPTPFKECNVDEHRDWVHYHLYCDLCC
jgi:hypothetical protein